MRRATRLAAALAALCLACSGPGGGGGAADGAGDTGPDAPGDGADGTADTQPGDVTTGDGDGSLDTGDGAPSDGQDAADFSDPDIPTVHPPGEPCPLGDRVGHFQLAHHGFYAAATGEVTDGIIPLTVLQPVLEEGSCRLLQKVNPFCSPACGAGELCDHDGSCVPYPANQPVGKVTVTGMLVDPLVMEPNIQDYYWAQDVPFPLFESGATIQLSAAGDGVAAFTLTGQGVTDLVLPDGILEMNTGEDLELAWEPAADQVGAIFFSLNIDQHGGSPVTMLCDADDTGTYTVSAALVDALLGFGVSGFATADFYRRTVDSVHTALGCVQLSVYSYFYGKLEVAGHTPCNVTPDCPEGEVCNVAIQTCVAEDSP